MTPSSKTKTFFIKLLDSIAQIQPDLTNLKTSSTPHSHFLRISICVSLENNSSPKHKALDTNGILSNLKIISCTRLGRIFWGFRPKRLTKMIHIIFWKPLSRWLYKALFDFISTPVAEHPISYPWTSISEKADTYLRNGWTLIRACCV